MPQVVFKYIELALREVRAAKKSPNLCMECDAPFIACRTDTKFCSAACRLRAWRKSRAA